MHENFNWIQTRVLPYFDAIEATHCEQHSQCLVRASRSQYLSKLSVHGSQIPEFAGLEPASGTTLNNDRPMILTCKRISWKKMSMDIWPEMKSFSCQGRILARKE